MANHVTTTVSIARGTPAAHKAMSELNSRHVALKDNTDWGGTVAAFALFEDTLAMYNAEDYVGVGSAIGAKWCFVYDYDDEDSISFESAWHTPSELLQRICEEITEADPDVILSYTSEDEGPNWVSSGVYADGELYDEETIDMDEYPDLGIKMWWDEEAEGKEEPDDFEPTWEELYELLDENVQSMIAPLSGTVTKMSLLMSSFF
jgi:hypothetical protein